MNASENRKDDPRGLLHPLVRFGWWVYQPSRALNEGGWERYAGPFDKEAEVREWHDVQPNKDHLRVGREVIEWEAGPNIAIAISADTREQSIAHKEEAQREIEQLERELAAVTAELLALRAESKALCEQVLSHNRTIAALVMQAGGEVRVDDLTIAMLPLDAEILTWSEPMERKTVVQVRTPKRQNKK